MKGVLVAFEGLDQSGKETQTRLLSDWFGLRGRKTRVVSFPEYGTPIGEEIARALRGERDYAPDVMQLLFIANRYEHRAEMERWLEEGCVLLCDRYVGSSVAYGEAHGLDPVWLSDMQKFLPQPDLTFVVDISPETAVRRKAAGRDRYERDLDLLRRVRESYLRQASQPNWVRIDGERAREVVADEIATTAASRLALQ